MIRLAERLRKKLEPTYKIVVKPFDDKTVLKFVDTIQELGLKAKDLDKTTRKLLKRVKQNYKLHLKDVSFLSFAGGTRWRNKIGSKRFEELVNQTGFLKDLKKDA